MSGSVPGAIQPVTPYQAPDILGQAGQYAGLQNQLISNQQNQQSLAARQAIGQAYAQATDPQTGQVDNNKLMALVAGGAGAFEAGDVASAVQQRAIQQQTLSGMQLDQAIKRSQYVGNGLQALWRKANSPQGVSGQDVIGQLGSAVADGVMTAPQASQYISDMPPGGAPLTQWLQNHMVNNGNTQQALQAMYGSAQTVDTGPAQTVQSVNPVTGQVAPLAGGTFINGMTPGDAGTLVQGGTNPKTGQPIMVTKQQAADMANGAANPFGTGRNTPPGVEPQPGGGLQMGLPAGQQGAMEVEGHASAQDYVQASQNAANVPQNKALLQNMAGDLQNFSSGPGNVEWRQTIAGLNRAFGTSIDASGVASAENFTKLGNQIAIAQAGQMGGGTNEKLEASMQANPNPHLSVPGNTQIIHILLGNQDAIGAWNQAAQAYQQKNGPQSYQQFVSDTSKFFDPRAFQMMNMSPEEQTATLKGMSYSQFHVDPKTGKPAGSYVDDYNQMAQAGMFAQYQRASPAASPPAAQASAASAPQVPTSP